MAWLLLSERPKPWAAQLSHSPIYDPQKLLSTGKRFLAYPVKVRINFLCGNNTRSVVFSSPSFFFFNSLMSLRISLCFWCLRFHHNTPSVYLVRILQSFHLPAKSVSSTFPSFFLPPSLLVFSLSLSLFWGGGISFSPSFLSSFPSFFLLSYFLSSFLLKGFPPSLVILCCLLLLQIVRGSEHVGVACWLWASS